MTTDPAFRDLEPDELAPLATGAWILGAGGGGSPYLSYLNLRQHYRGGGRVTLMDPMALADDDLVAVVSNMGAPLVGQERLSDPAYAAKPVRMMQDYLGRPFRAVMSVEIGGGNAIQPFLVAAETGLPVVDADAMGRAFPEAQMTSFAIGDLEMFPLTLADIRDNEVIITRAASWKWMERISRKACTEVGSIAATCKAPRNGAEVKEWGILHTVTKAIGIGRAVEAARARHADPIEAVLAHEGGKRVFRGKITDVARRTTEGFLRGSATIEGLDEDRGHEFRLEFQNEYAVGFLDGNAHVTVPDIITVIDSLSGEAIGTETLRYGQRVTVIALPSPEVLTTPKGLEHVGPRAFGYDLEFRSLFGAEA
ncbi:MAG: DUF917 domain-containing protein [Alphaproteobacteria bacterium]|nr:DUF917 domain-containing protein [Alphaproteobacteria bacterium]